MGGSGRGPRGRTAAEGIARSKKMKELYMCGSVLGAGGAGSIRG